jgi:hypothetical protein
MEQGLLNGLCTVLAARIKKTEEFSEMIGSDPAARSSLENMVTYRDRPPNEYETQHLFCCE